MSEILATERAKREEYLLRHCLSLPPLSFLPSPPHFSAGLLSEEDGKNNCETAKTFKRSEEKEPSKKGGRGGRNEKQMVSLLLGDDIRPSLHPGYTPGS